MPTSQRRVAYPRGVNLAGEPRPQPAALPPTEVVDETSEGGTQAQQAQSPPPERPSRVAKEKAKKPKKERVVPDGPKPDRGWRLWLYWLLCHLGRPDIVPRLSRGQQRRLMVAEIKDIIASGVRPVISVANIKSGGKTRVALAIASELAEHCKGLNVIVAPATENTATGSIVKMSGVSGKGTTMRLLAQNLNAFRSFGALSPALLLTKHGVRVVTEDANSAGGHSGKFGTENFIDVVRTLRVNCDVLILDHGNDNIAPDGIGVAALRMSDVVVFSARQTDPISVDKVVETYRGFLDDPYQGLTLEDAQARMLLPITQLPADGYKVLLPGELRRTIDKLITATFVMNCVNGKFTQDQFDLLTRPSEQSVRATFVPPVWEGEGVTVPEDKYLGKKGRVAVTALRKIGRKTNFSYLMATLAVMRDAEVAKYYADPLMAQLFGDSHESSAAVADSSPSPPPTDEATASGKDAS